jgi:hypothetical protein
VICSVVGLIVIAALEACGSKSPLVGEGGQCYQATDCAAGLVCIPQENGTSICDNNLNSIEMTEMSDSGEEAGANPLADGAAEMMNADAGAIDANAPRPDANGDANVPPGDANTPPVDANQTPPVDANTPPVDANTPPVDANTPPVDANTD